MTNWIWAWLWFTGYFFSIRHFRSKLYPRAQELGGSVFWVFFFLFFWPLYWWGLWENWLVSKMNISGEPDEDEDEDEEDQNQE